MAITVKVGNVTLKQIESLQFISEVPEDSNAKTSNMAVTVKMTGRIGVNNEENDAEDKSLKLEEWSRVSATSDDCYRDMVIETVSLGQVSRKYEMPNAFVVDYTEEFDIEQGIGHFTLIARQKKDTISKLKISGGFATE